ncbi:MAG: tetratricopeptide repeat protein [Saprospiraceae bacterium]
MEHGRKVLRSDPDSTIYFTKEAISLLKKSYSDSLALEIYLVQNDAIRMLGNMDELKRGLRICDSLNHKVKNVKASLTISNLKGLYFWQLSQFDSAIQCFIKVRELGLLLKDTVGIIKSYNNSGIIFSDLSKLDKAKTEYLTGIKFALLKKDSTGLIYLYNGLSNNYRAEEKYDSAIIFINRSIAISEIKHNQIDIQRGYSNLGATYFQMDEYGKAEEALLKGMAIAEKQHINQSLVKIYYHLAEVYIKTKKYDLADQYAKKVMTIATAEHYPEDVMYAHELFYRNAKAQNHFDVAMKRLELYMVAKDSIFKAESSARIAEIETKYRTAQKDLELQKLSSAIDILDKNKKLTQTRYIFISIGVLLLFLAIYLNKSMREMQREKRRREEYTAGILFSREDERKDLSRELHDHVGQNLVLLNQSLITGDIGKSKELTQDVLTDIRRVSRDLYPWQIEKLGLDAALKDLIKNTESLTSILMTYELDPLDKFVDRDRALQVYRIVQECLNNLVKHSNARSARISLHLMGDDLNLVIQDNGNGFDTKIQMNSTKSLGLMTLKDRIQSLKGKLEIESSEGKGSRFSFSFPAI